MSSVTAEPNRQQNSRTTTSAIEPLPQQILNKLDRYTKRDIIATSIKGKAGIQGSRMFSANMF